MTSIRNAARLNTARTPISHAIEQWSGFCQRYSPYTRDGYRQIIRDFVAYSQCQCLRDITTLAIQTFVNSLFSSHKVSTISTYQIAIKSFCRWLSDTYDIPNPAAKIRQYRREEEESRCLSREEYQKCLSVAEDRDYHLIRFLANTGLRASELTNLTPASIKGKWLVFKRKGNKTGHVPLNDHAAESLSVVMNFSRNRHTLLIRCHALAAKAGITPFGPHACRHYFATQLLCGHGDPNKVVPIHHVSKLLGHSSVLVTEKIYYHFRPEHLAGLTDCLE